MSASSMKLSLASVPPPPLKPGGATLFGTLPYVRGKTCLVLRVQCAFRACRIGGPDLVKVAAV